MAKLRNDINPISVGSEDIEKQTYDVNGINREFLNGNIDISDSSNRAKLVKTILKLQDSYFELDKEYEILLKHAPDSPECKQLSKECTAIYEECKPLVQLLLE